MSSTQYYDSIESGQNQEPSLKDNHSFFRLEEMVDSANDGSDEYDASDEYDDNNGYFKNSVSSVKKKEPDDFLNPFKKEFKGKTWKPIQFFQRMYLKNILAKTRKFIFDLGKLDLSELSSKTTLKEKISKATRIIKSAEKKYEVDQIECLTLITQAIVIGRKILEEFKRLDVLGKLDVE